ncbi:MAG TPA: hypothetical protein VHL31_03225 [Geminicoccus sp.]|uniref:hypothetical protein n=1 Tax=Geminicoccus sp. TaxID=2024832 RepID=UPI002E310661|nr:hypothetical protein [Geminicoccus sp.]HEX2525298.1 hypothetical protein [Geminicoccus sp.]
MPPSEDGAPAADDLPARLQHARAQILANLPVEPVYQPIVLAALDAIIVRCSRQAEIALRRGSLRARNRYIVELDAALPPQRSLDRRAQQVLDQVKAYESGALRRHRGLIQCPPELDGRPEGIVWHILKSFHRVPRSRTAIEGILKNASTDRN